jgi:two-component system NtrC family sensor kinase
MSLDAPSSRPSGGSRIYDWVDPVVREPAESDPQHRLPPLSWWWRGVLAAAFAIPLLLLAVAARQTYLLERQDLEAQVATEVGELHEQSLKVFETYELVLAWIDDRTRGLDWDRVAHDEGLHRFLSDIETLPQIQSTAIVDPTGLVRAGGQNFSDPAVNVADREYFAVQQRHAGGIMIGLEHPTSAAKPPDFVISRRRSIGPRGVFDGIITISARPSYFSDFYSTISQIEGFRVSLLRSDGTVLAGYPTPPSPVKYSPDSDLMRAIAAAPAQGLFRQKEGGERIYGYRQVKGLPLYVVFGIPTDAVLQAWRSILISYSLFAVPASLALFGLMLFAARQLQRQQVATSRWRMAAERLRREADRRSQVEAELRQAQKMEVLGQLTGGVAHDFNNLLTVLQGNLELLSGRQQDDKLQTKVDQALQTTERGARLTRQLLAFARRQPLWIEDIDLNALLRGMDELLTRTVGGGVAVETDLAPDLWPVAVDANQLELAVINLAINARDAMPKGGVLRLRTFNTHLSPGSDGGEAGGDFVALAVSDTGTGMPPEVRARAFEPFFTTKDPDKGTGLGLSMIYGLVSQSGGGARIDSEVGHGTTVTLHLPRADPPGRDRATDLPAGRQA